jgi:hypothetical protein
MLVALWAAMHRYKSVSGDAELYAVQAMARIHRGLASDLFLQNASQDRYTVFSSFYAACIDRLGLRQGALSLAMVFKIWLFVAAWVLARTLSSTRAAFIAVAFLIITDGTYGAFGVFRYAEDWLTARSPAEALVVTALALYFRGLRLIGWLIALCALFVHPLMALPGLLVLACLSLSFRAGVIAAVIGILICLGIAFGAVYQPSDVKILAVMDAEWYEVVRERSVFLFLQYWHVGDWTRNARPFLSLALTALVLPDARVRKLCIASILVGGTGLAVALIGSLVGPIAVMIQGQAWRWEWITCFVSVLLLAPAAAAMYRDTRCGPLCAVLLIAGWTFMPVDGAACVALALLLWLAREHIDSRTARSLLWAGGALAIIILAWASLTSWTAAFAPAADSGREALSSSRIRNILGLGVPAVALVLGLSYWIGRTRSPTVLALISCFLGASAACVLPSALRDTQRNGATAEITEFADWRQAIPPTSNVYVAPVHNSAAFAWFTLERPSYLSVDQSAGVVFSRAVAMEVKRRSQVLLPILAPDWRLLTGGSIASASGIRAEGPASQPLTRDRLVSVCQDPQLGFVVAKESVGFDPMPHRQRGDWMNWHLYDCRHVRSLSPTT